MKQKCAVGFVVGMMSLFWTVAIAQNTETTYIEPQRLYITANKTSNLVFPYAIKSIDRGSKDVLVQKASGVENILQLKAATPEFAETNLTVVTADGAFFSYLLNYSENPAGLNLRVLPNSGLEPLAVFNEHATTDEVGKQAKAVNVKQRSLHKQRDQRYDVALDLKGLYIHNDILYFQLALINNSNLAYDVQQLRFFTRDKKRARRTASQEIELQPIYIAGDASKIPGSAAQSVTVALTKFTIPDNKYLCIQLMEANGGRHLELTLNNHVIIKALPVR
jgi:conjugative transposon TraN protein